MDGHRDYYIQWNKSEKERQILYDITCIHVCMHVCVYPTNCSILGSSFQGTLQSRILKWVAISFSRVFSQARELTQVSCIAGRFFTIWATWEAYIYIYIYIYIYTDIYSCCSVAQLCLPLCDIIHCSMPGFPVHHHLLELAWTHVHWVSDAIQPSPPLSSPSPVLMFASWSHTGFSGSR